MSSSKGVGGSNGSMKVHLQMSAWFLTHATGKCQKTKPKTKNMHREIIEIVWEWDAGESQQVSTGDEHACLGRTIRQQQETHISFIGRNISCSPAKGVENHASPIVFRKRGRSIESERVVEADEVA